MGTKDTTPLGDEPSYTISEFCRLERISMPTYVKERNAGIGPREMRSPVTNTVRISPEARRDYHRRKENPTGTDAEAVRAKAEQLRAKAHDAAAKAVKSERHISNVTDEERRKILARARRRKQTVEA